MGLAVESWVLTMRKVVQWGFPVILSGRTTHNSLSSPSYDHFKVSLNFQAAEQESGQGPRLAGRQDGQKWSKNVKNDNFFFVQKHSLECLEGVLSGFNR